MAQGHAGKERQCVAKKRRACIFPILCLLAQRTNSLWKRNGLKKHLYHPLYTIKWHFTTTDTVHVSKIAHLQLHRTVTAQNNINGFGLEQN